MNQEAFEFEVGYAWGQVCVPVVEVMVSMVELHAQQHQSLLFRYLPVL